MKYCFLAFLLLFSKGILAVEVRVISPTIDELKSMDMLLIDIREPHEWLETGIVEGSIPLTISSTFVQELEAIKDGRPIALICRTANRSHQLARHLSRYFNEPVYDINGGILKYIRSGYVTTAYQNDFCYTC